MDRAAAITIATLGVLDMHFTLTTLLAGTVADEASMLAQM